MRGATILLALGGALLAAGCAAPHESGEAGSCLDPNGTSAYGEAGSNDSCPWDDPLAGSGRETAEEEGGAPTGY